MKPSKRIIKILSIIFIISLIGGLGYYTIIREKIWRAVSFYNLKEYQLDIKKTVPVDHVKPIKMESFLKKLVVNHVAVDSNFITVQVVGTAQSTEKEALPYIFIKDDGESFYVSIYSGISAKKLLKENGFYKEEYSINLYAPEKCFPIKVTPKITDYWIEGLQEKISNSMERDPSDEEIAVCFSGFIDAVKNHDTNALAAILSPIDALDSTDTVEGRIDLAAYFFIIVPKLFFYNYPFRIKTVKKVVLKDKKLFLVKAEYFLDNNWHSYKKNIWFRMVEGKLGLHSFE